MRAVKSGMAGSVVVVEKHEVVKAMSLSSDRKVKSCSPQIIRYLREHLVGRDLTRYIYWIVWKFE